MCVCVCVCVCVRARVQFTRGYKWQMHTVFLSVTSVLFSHSNFEDFKENINTVFETSNKWSKRNLLTLHFEKTD